MKNLSKILFLCGVIVLMASRCEKNDVDAGDFEPVTIKKFTDFGCDDCSVTLKPEYANHGYYVIYSENDFNKYVKYVTGENIPSIDFEKYFLIIGTKNIAGGGSITGEKAVENNIEIIYTVTITRDETHIDGTTLKYHAFIEKPIKEKAVRVEIIILP